MAGTTFAWVALAVWVLGGLVGYAYLYRHAHPHPGWLLASMILGPFAVVVFTDRVERSSHVVVERRVTDGRGTMVVVGIDGSDESRHALDVARRIVGAQRCCLVLCEVVDYDTEEDPTGAGVAAATARLERVAADLPGTAAIVEVLAGPPVKALVDAADEHDADLIVVGTRGCGVSRRLLGSVAEGLLTASARPVLITHDRGT
jgi:nucleotide-binding universal stress UspA family protein